MCAIIPHYNRLTFLLELFEKNTRDYKIFLSKIFKNWTMKIHTFSFFSDSEDDDTSLSDSESLSESVDVSFFFTVFLVLGLVEFLLFTSTELTTFGLELELILLFAGTGLTFVSFLVSLALPDDSEADSSLSDSLFSSLSDSDSDPASEPELALLASSLFPASEAELTEAA